MSHGTKQTTMTEKTKHREKNGQIHVITVLFREKAEFVHGIVAGDGRCFCLFFSLLVLLRLQWFALETAS
jgi:hypothetical protein